MANVPMVPDFSSRAIGKEVVKQAMCEPWFLGPAVLGAIGAFAVDQLAFSWWVVLPLPLALLALGFNLLVRRGSLVAQYLQNYNKMSRQRAEELAGYLQNEFDELTYPRGQEQIVELKEHLATIGHVLRDRFQEGGMSFQQFYTPAEALYIQTLNRLKDAAAQLRVNQTNDVSRSHPASTETGNGAEARRREIYQEGMQRFQGINESVEQAITGLTQLSADVAHIGTDTDKGYEAFVARVQDVASRAHLYADEKRISA